MPCGAIGGSGSWSEGRIRARDRSRCGRPDALMRSECGMSTQRDGSFRCLDWMISSNKGACETDLHSLHSLNDEPTFETNLHFMEI